MVLNQSSCVDCTGVDHKQLLYTNPGNRTIRELFGEGSSLTDHATRVYVIHACMMHNSSSDSNRCLRRMSNNVQNIACETVES